MFQKDQVERLTTKPVNGWLVEYRDSGGGVRYERFSTEEGLITATKDQDFHSAYELGGRVKVITKIVSDEPAKTRGPDWNGGSITTTFDEDVVSYNQPEKNYETQRGISSGSPI